MNVVDSSGWLEYFADGPNALPMADAVILATAQAHGATLWTQDNHFSEIRGVRYFPKPRK